MNANILIWESCYIKKNSEQNQAEDVGELENDHFIWGFCGAQWSGPQKYLQVPGWDPDLMNETLEEPKKLRFNWAPQGIPMQVVSQNILS